MLAIRIARAHILNKECPGIILAPHVNRWLLLNYLIPAKVRAVSSARNFTLLYLCDAERESITQLERHLLGVVNCLFA